MVCSITTGTAEAVAIGSALPGVIAVVALIALLITKELCAAIQDSRSSTLTRHLNVAVAPLFVVFLSILIYKILLVII